MLIKFDSTFKEALKIAGETDFAAQGARLVGISAIGGFTYMQIELLASDGVLSGIVTSIEEVKAVADQTGAEMVTAQEALSPGSRLSHAKLDDVGASDHHTKYTDAEVDTIVAVHAALATVHQDAPALIGTHETGGNHRWTADKVLVGAGAGADPTEMTINVRLTVAMMQAISGEGTATGPEKINDGSTGPAVTNMDAVGEYAEIRLLASAKMTQFRFYGDSPQNGDGVSKIQDLDGDYVWQDWVTGLSTRVESWSNWDSSGGEVIALGIRIVATTLDSNNNKNMYGELEVKY